MQLAHLRTLTTWFLHNKSINGAQGLDVTLSMRVAVAVQACLLILNLDIDYFDNWVEVILYPNAFRVNHQRVDAIGLVHDDARVLSGESWLRGPVILSWDNVERGAYQYQPGSNVVFHEFAHKLDGLNGTTNGMPPLPQRISQQRWTEDFSQAYEALRLQVAVGEPTLINPYASTSPAEFFAVLTEYYFTEPDILKFCCPGVYRQLKAFYRLAA